MREEITPNSGERLTRALSARKSPLQSRGKDTVEAILEAAGAQIDLEGLHRLTTRRIAQEAGISIGALYEYFPNKESIILALTERWMRQIYDVAERLHPHHGVTRDALTYLNEVIEGIAPHYRDQRGLSTINTMLKSVPDLRKAMEAHNQRFVELIASALSTFAPDAQATEVAAVARTFLIIGHPLISEAYVVGTPYPEKFIEHLKVCMLTLAARLILPPGRR